MDRKELEELLILLGKYHVETYSHKELQITFRFPKKEQAMLVVSPQEQVEAFEEQQEETEDLPPPEDKSGLSALPPVFKQLFRAVPRKV